MDKNIQTFHGIIKKTVFVENKDGKKNIQEFDLTYQKKNNEPGIRELKLKNKKDKKKYVFSDDKSIFNYMRNTPKKKEPLYERLSRLLSKNKTQKKKQKKRKKTKKAEKKQKKTKKTKKWRKTKKRKKAEKKRKNKKSEKNKKKAEKKKKKAKMFRIYLLFINSFRITESFLKRYFFFIFQILFCLNLSIILIIFRSIH